MQYPILFKRLFDAGINGKTWRLIRNWYTNPKCMVRSNGCFSSPFTIERGVLQGSVLSPVLFLLVMDPLLQGLEANRLGPSLHNTYLGAFAHADDIRTITSSRTTLQKQVEFVQKFCADNALTLNLSKCEVLTVSPTKPTQTSPICNLDDQHQLVPCESAKCLGYWWSWDLSSTKAIHEAISKARRGFFSLGSLGAFMGKLNPLSGRAIYEACVIPTLLYGCENWVLSDANITILEAFQGEISRRILRLSKSHSLLSTRVALQLQSIASRILSRKLSLLHRVSIGSESIGQKVYSELTLNGPQRLSLVEECLSLEDKVGCNGVTQDVLDGNSASARGRTKLIVKMDWEKCLCDAQSHQSTHVVAEIASSTSWLKLWDMALDHGQQGTLSLQTLFRELSRPCYGSKPCHRCDIESLEEHYFHHFISSHLNITVSPSTIIRQLADGDPDVFRVAKHILRMT